MFLLSFGNAVGEGCGRVVMCCRLVHHLCFLTPFVVLVSGRRSTFSQWDEEYHRVADDFKNKEASTRTDSSNSIYATIVNIFTTLGGLSTYLAMIILCPIILIVIGMNLTSGSDDGTATGKQGEQQHTLKLQLRDQDVDSPNHLTFKKQKEASHDLTKSKKSEKSIKRKTDDWKYDPDKEKLDIKYSKQNVKVSKITYGI